jgi:hypothetical protein
VTSRLGTGKTLIFFYSEVDPLYLLHHLVGDADPGEEPGQRYRQRHVYVLTDRLPLRRRIGM